MTFKHPKYTLHAEELDLLGNGNHAVRMPESQPVYNDRAPIMTNRDLVITEVLKFIAVDGGDTVCMVRTTLGILMMSRREDKSSASFLGV